MLIAINVVSINAIISNKIIHPAIQAANHMIAERIAMPPNNELNSFFATCAIYIIASGAITRKLQICQRTVHITNQEVIHNPNQMIDIDSIDATKAICLLVFRNNIKIIHIEINITNKLICCVITPTLVTITLPPAVALHINAVKASANHHVIDIANKVKDKFLLVVFI